jgi:ligand-binding SRPBCC domain-containing protein
MPVVMHAGLEIDYRIVVRGLPLPWRSRIEVWEPNVCFVDRQTLGPYRWWRHGHRFESVAAGTRVIDQLEFVPRFSWISQSLVTRDVDRIFAYRRAQLPALVSHRS